MRWKLLPSDPAAAARLSERLGITSATARLLCQRGLAAPDEARAFLHPRLADLTDPDRVRHLPAAVERVRRALHQGERILVFGDYDVDGTTSIALLSLVLRQFGADLRYAVPRRLEEGYGLTRPALERAFAEAPPPHLLIAVDCGTSSRAEVAWLRGQGVDVIILDHHRSKEALPEDCILVNPHVFDDPHAPWVELSAVGLSFKFLHAFLKALRQDGDTLAHEIRLRDYLDLVALGTLADLVPLTGENRILARAGLEVLGRATRPGLLALLEAAGFRLGSRVGAFGVSFRLAPRLNAGGRLDDAVRPIELLLGSDPTACRHHARFLDDLNRERQAIEHQVANEAIAQVEDRFAAHPGIIVFNASWHAGVVGIVASRLVQRYHRPAIVLGSEGQLARGSGRSREGIDLVAALTSCAGLLQRWGGHPMAVGLSVALDRLDQFRDTFCKALGALPSAKDDSPCLKIHARLDPAEVTPQLLDELDLLEPFGQGNTEPVFLLQHVRLLTRQPLATDHLRFTVALADGKPGPDGVMWNVADNAPPQDLPIDLAVRARWNEWAGRRVPRLTLLDWRAS